MPWSLLAIFLRMEANNERQLPLRSTHEYLFKRKALPLEVIDEEASLHKRIRFWRDAYRWADILFSLIVLAMLAMGLKAFAQQIPDVPATPRITRWLAS